LFRQQWARGAFIAARDIGRREEMRKAGICWLQAKFCNIRCKKVTRTAMVMVAKGGVWDPPASPECADHAATGSVGKPQGGEQLNNGGSCEKFLVQTSVPPLKAVVRDCAERANSDSNG
jgi:hypothetical protein